LFDTTREIVAYGIVGIIVVVAIPWLIHTVNQRRREKLRRRGIKRYGH
jgi:type II secretory pathway pseudopilin PulG